MLKILVAVDGSELSLDAVQHVLQLLRQGLRATVVLAHVQEPATLYELVTSRDPDLIAAASVQAGEHLLATARALLDAAGVAYETDIGVGDAAHVLVDMAERNGAGLVVIGAKGQGALSGVLLGSVSQEVARASGVPVTIVKHAQEPDGGLDTED
jgi:nucleotide-binding universal stress UspA family protein